jgi:hypothetical protein
MLIVLLVALGHGAGEARAEDELVIELKSEPTGAQIILDGQRIGITNGSFLTFPGPHLVTLERDGYLTESIQVAAEKGKPAQISATLRAAPVPVRAPGRLPARRSRLVAEVVMMAGVAVILGGLVLHAADHDPFPGDPLQYPNTAPVGTAFSVAGLAAVGAGAYLWWRADF